MSMDGIRNLEEERLRIIERIAGCRAAFASTARTGRADRNV
jgi:hypothetical protein